MCHVRKVKLFGPVGKVPRPGARGHRSLPVTGGRGLRIRIAIGAHGTRNRGAIGGRGAQNPTTNDVPGRTNQLGQVGWVGRVEQVGLVVRVSRGRRVKPVDRVGLESRTGQLERTGGRGHPSLPARDLPGRRPRIASGARGVRTPMPSDGPGRTSQLEGVGQVGQVGRVGRVGPVRKVRPAERVGLESRMGQVERTDGRGHRSPVRSGGRGHRSHQGNLKRNRRLLRTNSRWSHTSCFSKQDQT